MTDKYKFKDRAWNIVHNDGRHIDKVSVHADDVREAYSRDTTLKPSTHEDEILSNAVQNVLYRHKLKPDDVEVNEEVSKPKPVTRKANGGRVCW